MSQITQELAQFCVATGYRDLRDDVKEDALRTLDLVLSLAGSRARFLLMNKIAEVAPVTKSRRFGAVDVAASIHRQVPSFAAMSIGAAASLAGGEHFTPSERLACVVVPAAFVGAQLGRCTGANLVRSIALGNEIARRAATALGATHRTRGWDVAGTAGRLGATAAAATVLDCDVGTIHDAFGFASTTAAGMRIGDDAIGAIGVGKAAADALEAAILAREGLIGPPEPIAGRRGLFALTAPDGDVEALVETLGEIWQLSSSIACHELAEFVDHIASDPDCDALVRAFGAWWVQNDHGHVH